MRFELDVNEFERLADLIYQKAGIRFEQKKIYYLAKRLEKRIVALDLANTEEYLRHLKFRDHRGYELQEFLNSLTVNETYFFRDFNQLLSFAEFSLDQIVERKKRAGDQTLRIWSAGCSSGEEPYTIAIILKEMVENLQRWNVEIIASDIDLNILEKARQGAYMRRSVKDVPQDYLTRYFTQKAGIFKITDEIKEMVTFKHINLSDRKQLRPCRDFDFIFCRNVLIYFDNISRKKVVDHYYLALNNGGFIFLGSSESPSRINPAFKIKKSANHMVYYKE